MHIGNTEFFYFIIEQPTPEPKIRDQNLCLSTRNLMSVVKDVDLEAMPTSIFLNDDDDNDDDESEFDHRSAHHCSLHNVIADVKLLAKIEVIFVHQKSLTD